MNKDSLARNVAVKLRINGDRKQMPATSHILHISDEDGISQDLSIKLPGRALLYSSKDVKIILDAILESVYSELTAGRPVSLTGFGTISLKYHKPITVRSFSTGEDIQVEGRYVPKMTFGSNVHRCAKLYTDSIKEKGVETEPLYDEDEYLDDGEEVGTIWK